MQENETLQTQLEIVSETPPLPCEEEKVLNAPGNLTDKNKPLSKMEGLTIFILTLITMLVCSFGINDH